MLLSQNTSHCKIFSADADVRLARRIRRDTVEKGRDIGTVLDQVCKFHWHIQRGHIKKITSCTKYIYGDVELFFFFLAEILLEFIGGEYDQ